MDGRSEIVLPSKINFQSVGESGVTTSRPQPQQHLWIADAYSMEMYIVPSLSFSGMFFTNLCDSFIVEDFVDVDFIRGMVLVLQIVVKAEELLPFDDRHGGI